MDNGRGGAKYSSNFQIRHYPNPPTPVDDVTTVRTRKRDNGVRLGQFSSVWRQDRNTSCPNKWPNLCSDVIRIIGIKSGPILALILPEFGRKRIDLIVSPLANNFEVMKILLDKFNLVSVPDPPWSPVIPLCFAPARPNGFIFLFGFNAKSCPDWEPFQSKQKRIRPTIIPPTRAWSPMEGVQWLYPWRHNRDGKP